MSAVAAVGPRPARGEERLAYRAKIDGLRGVAILLVIGYHYLPSLVSVGYVGVDVFFVISGYLISQMLLGGKIQFLEFYFRRARRLGPALIVAGLFILVLSVPHHWPFQLAAIGRQALASAWLYPNLYFLATRANYFDNQTPDLLPFRHYWSLGIEEQFYLLYPLVLAVIGRRTTRPAVTRVVLLTLWVVSFLSMLVLHGRPASFFLPITRAWELLSGCLLAHQERAGGHRQIAIVWAACVLLAAGCAARFGAGAWPNLWAVVPVGLALCLVALPDGSALGRALSTRPLVFVGLISYPLYLFHPSMATLTAAISRSNPAIGAALAIVASVIASYCVWRFLEQPIRSIRLRSLASYQTAMLMVAPAVVVSSVGGLFVVTDGFRAARQIENYDQTIAQLDLSKTPEKTGSILDEIRFYRLGLQSGLRLSTTDFRVAPTWLVGDSHAWHLFYGLSRLPRFASGLSLIARESTPALSGVELIYDVGRRRLGAVDWNAHLDQFVAAATADQARLIILSFMGPQLFYGKGGIGGLTLTPIVMERVPAEHVDPETVFVEGLSDTLRNIYAANPKNRIVVAMDVPELTFEPYKHFQVRDHWASLDVPGTVPVESTLRRQATYRRALARVTQAFPRVAVFDPLPCFSDGTNVHAMIDGDLMYYDSGHLTPLGSMRYAACFDDFINAHPGL